MLRLRLMCAGRRRAAQAALLPWLRQVLPPPLLPDLHWKRPRRVPLPASLAKAG